MARVIVIGGGAVGLCVAEARGQPWRRGDRVRADDAGRRVGRKRRLDHPVARGPRPRPGVIRESLRWLVNPSGPLWIRPTLSPAMLAWIARFIVSCARPAYQRGLIALQGAAALAGPAFDRLAERGVEFELHDEPLLYPAFEQSELEHLWHVADELRGVGAGDPLDRLSTGELRALEPALSEGVVGGMIARGDRRVRPEMLCDGVRRALVAGGGEVFEHSPVEDLIRDGSTWIVESRSVMRRADAVVLAHGVGSARLLCYVGDAGADRGGEGLQPHVRARSERTAPRAVSGGAEGRDQRLRRRVRVSGTLELGARA